MMKQYLKKLYRESYKRWLLWSFLTLILPIFLGAAYFLFFINSKGTCSPTPHDCFDGQNTNKLLVGTIMTSANLYAWFFKRLFIFFIGLEIVRFVLRLLLTKGE